MLREERAVGGSSRHLWVKLNLPEHPGGLVAASGLQLPSWAAPWAACHCRCPEQASLSHPADLHAYFSPILHQIRISTSRIEAEQWVHATGGAGWIALQVGPARVHRPGRPRQPGLPHTWRQLRLSNARACVCCSPDGDGEDGLRCGRDPEEPAAARLARQPLLPEAAPPRPPV